MQATEQTRIAVSKERHRMLTEDGFIHVTGLTMIGTGELEGKEIGRIGCDIHESERGTYGIPSGMSVLVTMDRQVWIASNNLNERLEKLAPNGHNIEISFKWRPKFRQRDLLCRLADPNWKPDDLPYQSPTVHDIDQVLSDLPLPPRRQQNDSVPPTE